jgi:hypothetical protein
MAKKYKVHPLAETYPPMDEAELEALTPGRAGGGQGPGA